MNKEELIKEYDKKAKALRDEFISKLEDDKKEFEVELPNKYDVLYFIDDISSEVYMTGFSTSKNEIARYLRGYFFETKEEAEQHLKECKLLFTIKKWAKEKNEGWVPDWGSVFQEKYYIFYDYYRKELCTSFNNSTGAINKLPYFKTRKIAQECIDLFGDEIIEVLCNEVE
jgi:hypothetical protein|nr:MAG TPA: hypothetical protein [Bacteriophage sp.]